MINYLLEKLNKEEFIDCNELSDEDNLFFHSLNLITTKPKIYVCNVDEKSITNGNQYSKKVESLAIKEKNNIVLVSAAIESQITEFDNPQDKLEILKDLGINETTLNKVISSGYAILNLFTYFTCGPKETRAWTIKKNTTAPQAAGIIHTDFEKGFIRAETIKYNDFIKFNGESACREAGKLRHEGKDYIVEDGDIMHFLFNV